MYIKSALRHIAAGLILYMEYVGLPDNHAFVGRTEHRVAFGYAESGEEGLDVAQRYVDTPFAERVGVAHGALTDFVLADVAGPYIGIGEIEALVGRETVDYRTFGSVERILVCCVGDTETALVGDVLPESKTSVGFEAGSNFDAVELGDELVGKSVEGFSIGGCPPVGKIAVFVKLTALVVESMSHFVADDNADSAIVDRIVGFGVEEGHLEDTGREADFVCAGVVVGIHCLGRHEPAFAVNGFAVVGVVIVLVEEDSLLYVFPV